MSCEIRKTCLATDTATNAFSNAATDNVTNAFANVTTDGGTNKASKLHTGNPYSYTNSRCNWASGGVQVRRKADPAKGGFQEFIRVWVDDGRVIGTVSHTEIKGETSKLKRVVVAGAVGDPRIRLRPTGVRGLSAVSCPVTSPLSGSGYFFVLF